MDNALIVVLAALLGVAFGYMVGRFSGFVDAKNQFRVEANEVEAKWSPKRDARGRFIKRK